MTHEIGIARAGTATATIANEVTAVEMRILIILDCCNLQDDSMKVVEEV